MKGSSRSRPSLSTMHISINKMAASMLLMLSLSSLASVATADTVMDVFKGLNNVGLMYQLITSKNSTFPSSLTSLLNGSGNVTLLAFTDAAYTKAQQSPLYKEFFSDPETTAVTLTYHLLAKSLDVSISGLPPFSYPETCLSQPGSGFNQVGFGKNQSLVLAKSSKGDSYFGTGTIVAFIKETHAASNGFVYVIDSVLIPPLNYDDTCRTLLKSAVSEYNNWVSTSGSPGASISSLQSVTILVASTNGIHDFIFLLPAIVAAGQLPSPVPTPVQVYPPGYTGTKNDGSIPYGNDFPMGAVLGGVIGGFAVIACGVIFVLVIRRRRRILQREKEIRDELERQMVAMGVGKVEDEEGQEDGQGEGDEQQGEGGVAATAIVVGRVALKDGDGSGEKRNSKRVSKRVSYASNVATTATNLTPGSVVAGANNVTAPTPENESEFDDEDDDDEDDDDEEYEEEEGEDVQKALREAQRILEYRRSNWSEGDSRRSSSGPNSSTNNNVNGSNAGSGSDKGSIRNKRDSTVSSNGGNNKRDSMSGGGKRDSIGNNKRDSRISIGGGSTGNKRLSTYSTSLAIPPSPPIADPKEAKKENIRNSWWSATGVGAGVTDPAVLEAQARREEQRRSWWSGSDVNAIAVSVAANLITNGPSSSSSSGASVVSGGENKRRSGISTTGSNVGAGNRNSVVGGGADNPNRKSWWSSKSGGGPMSPMAYSENVVEYDDGNAAEIVVIDADAEEGVEYVKLRDRQNKRNSGVKPDDKVGQRKSKVSLASVGSGGAVVGSEAPSSNGDSALAFVVGGGDAAEEKK
ncbi:hypothetical protein HDU76_014041 [Blyttiomyces sp. JEL0837]|nr:hypothetical protein HDU76_014041 [Blyttiomyces sp. JEL0837]